MEYFPFVNGFFSIFRYKFLTPIERCVKMSDTIFDRIKKLADEKGMSIAEVERKSDLGNGIIRRWDKSIPTADKLQNVADTLGTSTRYLLLGEKDETSEKVKILARDANDLTDVQLDLVRSMIKEFKKQNEN